MLFSARVLRSLLSRRRAGAALELTITVGFLAGTVMSVVSAMTTEFVDQTRILVESF